MGLIEVYSEVYGKNTSTGEQMRIVYDEENQTQEKSSSRLIRMISLIFKWGSAGLFLGLAAFLLYLYVTADPPNYCAEQKRFFSDSEYLHKKLEGLMKSGKMKLGPSDTSVEAYLVNHPDCCGVERIQRDFFATVINSSPIRVSVSYEMSEEKFKRERSIDETYYVDIQDMSSCGKYGEWAGTTETPPK